MRWPAVVATLVLAWTLAGGCTSAEHRGPRSLHPAWREVTLPVPPGPAGRLAVRDATSCDGTWYVVGAVLGPDGTSRPAAWRSDDARTWQPLRVEGSAFYARRAILSSVACRDGRIAAVGARSGGAHGNARVTSWYQRSDGTLVDMPATFVLYGGSQAVDVNAIAAGADGWLITGNRTSGAAVWLSGDATDFRLLDHDPALASDPGHDTVALDAVGDGPGWTVVGRVETPGRVAPAPLAWSSADGTHWTRQPVPAGTDSFGDLERVEGDGGDLVAAGLRGDRFGTWWRSGGRWRVGPAFGSVASDLSQPPFVSGLATRARAVVAAVSDGARFRVWAGSGRRWSEVVTPTRTASRGDTTTTVAADGYDVLLLSDDGTSGRVWLTGWNTLSR